MTRQQDTVEELNIWPAYTDLLSNLLLVITFMLALVVLAPRLAVQEKKAPKKDETPPLVTLPDSASFRFPSGSAALSPAFRQNLEREVVPVIEKNARDYGIDLIELIGHTDGQPNTGATSNLDALIGRFGERQVPTRQMSAGSNTDLGLMRALSVVQYLRELQVRKGRLAGVRFRAYSAGQLLLSNGQPAPPGYTDDSRRRRIEIRFTRIGREQQITGSGSGG